MVWKLTKKVSRNFLELGEFGNATPFSYILLLLCLTGKFKLSQANVNPEMVQSIIDARGLKCPEPIMIFRNALRKLEDQAIVKLLATDPTTLRDVPTMCRFLGHKIEFSETVGDEYHFIVSVRVLN